VGWHLIVVVVSTRGPSGGVGRCRSMGTRSRREPPGCCRSLPRRRERARCPDRGTLQTGTVPGAPSATQAPERGAWLSVRLSQCPCSECGQGWASFWARARVRREFSTCSATARLVRGPRRKADTAVDEFRNEREGGCETSGPAALGVSVSSHHSMFWNTSFKAGTAGGAGDTEVDGAACPHDPTSWCPAGRGPRPTAPRRLGEVAGLPADQLQPATPSSS